MKRIIVLEVERQSKQKSRSKSNLNRKVAKGIESNQNKDTKKERAKKRNTKRSEKSRTKQKKAKLEKELETLEHVKNDSKKYLQARRMKALKSKGKVKEINVKEDEGNFITRDRKKAELIKDYLQKLLGYEVSHAIQ